MTGHATVLGINVLWFILQVVGYALLAGAAAGLVSFLYRVRIREDFPESAALIVGVGVVAVYLNTRIVFVQFIGEGADVLSVDTALANVVFFVAAGVAASGGRTAGHRIASSERFSWAGIQPSFSPIVRATGRFITITLPEEIDDIEGYDPVSAVGKAALSGRMFEFPRGLTVQELENQLANRLTEKHDIGYVDVELSGDGTVEYLAVGQRPAGIGKTLPPGMAAVALRSDPPFSASPGDTIEIWHGDDPESLGMAELRASTEDIATVAADESLCERIDPDQMYRIMTLAADAQPEREFAAQLRRSAETMTEVRVGEGSALVGMSIGALDVTVIGVRRDGEVITIPGREQLIAAGDCLSLLGRPDRLRKLEAGAGVEVLNEQDPARAIHDWHPATRRS